MSTALKYTLMALVALVTVAIAAIAYRMYLQFNQQEIRVYVREQAARYKDQAAAYRIIMDGVEYLLGSHNLTQQVLRSSRATGTDKEQELVNAAINQCIAFKYLPAQS